MYFEWWECILLISSIKELLTYKGPTSYFWAIGASRNHITIITHAFVLRENSAIRTMSGEMKCRLHSLSLHFTIKLWRTMNANYQVVSICPGEIQKYFSSTKRWFVVFWTSTNVRDNIIVMRSTKTSHKYKTPRNVVIKLYQFLFLLLIVIITEMISRWLRCHSHYYGIYRNRRSRDVRRIWRNSQLTSFQCPGSCLKTKFGSSKQMSIKTEGDYGRGHPPPSRKLTWASSWRGSVFPRRTSRSLPSSEASRRRCWATRRRRSAT